MCYLANRRSGAQTDGSSLLAKSELAAQKWQGDNGPYAQIFLCK